MKTKPFERGPFVCRYVSDRQKILFSVPCASVVKVFLLIHDSGVADETVIRHDIVTGIVVQEHSLLSTQGLGGRGG
jgi:hypothetical protein